MPNIVSLYFYPHMTGWNKKIELTLFSLNAFGNLLYVMVYHTIIVFTFQTNFWLRLSYLLIFCTNINTHLCFSIYGGNKLSSGRDILNKTDRIMSQLKYLPSLATPQVDLVILGALLNEIISIIFNLFYSFFYKKNSYDW